MQQIKKMIRKTLSVLLLAAMALSLLLSGCGSGKESVLIYTSAEDYRVEDLTWAWRSGFRSMTSLWNICPPGISRRSC